MTIIVATILTVIAIVIECALRDTSLDELHQDLTGVEATAAMGPGWLHPIAWRMLKTSPD